MTDDAIKVEELTVNYEKTPVLWDINFKIPRGILLGIIGPNGAGKSTLLKALLGMLNPISGEISFFGKSLRQMQGNIAYVPQRNSVDWDFPLTVKDVVLMGRYGHLGPFKWPKATDRKIAQDALEKVGMLSFADRQIGELSGGQQQRVFIARALTQQAELYLMDEPFAGVDVATEKYLIELFQALAKEGKTLVIVHHDLESVSKYFDWLLMLNTCLVAHGPVSDVFHQENLLRTYGRGSVLLDEATKISHTKSVGLR